ncbi:endonuclease domain-containing protein [Aquabacter sp. CN5-332]|uniref:endonuclease domain-containing protein n=1 Tax=Aquabacter sp. CN5-332 TaxID=3156608 RepID=UPI0032B62296
MGKAGWMARTMEGPRTKAQALRSRQTSAEGVLWRALRGRRFEGWKFRRQHAVGPYVVDFICLATALVIEVDGVTHSEPRDLERDTARTAYLQHRNLRVVRVSNQDIYDNLDGVLEMIRLELSLPSR